MPIIYQNQPWASALGGITGLAAGVLRAQQEKKLRDEQLARQKQIDQENQAYRQWQMKHGEEELAVRAMEGGLVPKPGGGYGQYQLPPENPATAGAAAGVGLTAAMTGGAQPAKPAVLAAPANPATGGAPTGQPQADPLAELRTVATTAEGMAEAWKTIYTTESHKLERMMADPNATPFVIQKQREVVKQAADEWGSATTKSTAALEAVSTAQQKAHAAAQLQADTNFQNKFYAATSSPQYTNLPPEKRREVLRKLLAQAPMDRESQGLVKAELADVDKEISGNRTQRQQDRMFQITEKRLGMEGQRLQHLLSAVAGGRETPAEKIAIATAIHQMNRDYDNKHPNATAGERARAAIDRFNAITDNTALRQQYNTQVTQWLMNGGESSGPMPVMPELKHLGGGGGRAPVSSGGAQPKTKVNPANGKTYYLHSDGNYYLSP